MLSGSSLEIREHAGRNLRIHCHVTVTVIVLPEKLHITLGYVSAFPTILLFRCIVHLHYHVIFPCCRLNEVEIVFMPRSRLDPATYFWESCANIANREYCCGHSEECCFWKNIYVSFYKYIRNPESAYFVLWSICLYSWDNSKTT